MPVLYSNYCRLWKKISLLPLEPEKKGSRKHTHVIHVHHVKYVQHSALAFAQQGLFAQCDIMAFHGEDGEALLRTPLLAVTCPDDAPATQKPANVKVELRGLLLLSAPVMVQLSAQYAVTVVNQYFIGHQGAGPLAAAAIGNTVSCSQRAHLWPVPQSSNANAMICSVFMQWFNVSWYFLMGVSTALDTLGSQGNIATVWTDKDLSIDARRS